MNHPPAPQAKKQWTDKLANHVLCDYFYIFFVIFSVMAGISFIGGVYIFTTTKMPFGQLMSVIFSILLSFGVYSIAALFLYLICDRALPKDGFYNFEDAEEADAFYNPPAADKKPAGFIDHQ